MSRTSPHILNSGHQPLGSLTHDGTSSPMRRLATLRLPSPLLNLPCWSLKRQIQTLGSLVVMTFILAIGLGWQLWQQTETAQVAEAARQLAAMTDRLVTQYRSLTESLRGDGTPDPPAAGDDARLRSATTATLRGVAGVEGGFYALQGDRLLGYAFPTYAGSGPKTDIPPAEIATILRVVGRAMAHSSPADEQVAAGSDVILFRASPLVEAGRPVGAAWLMHRLSGLRNPQWQLLVLGFIGMLAISGTIAAGSWFMAFRIDQGVATIERGLQAMEHRLGTPVPAVGIPELDRVGLAITRLSVALQDHESRRATLEQKLHHAERLTALGRLVAGVAHEVRNPLSSIKLRLQLARRNGFDAAHIGPTFDVMEEEVTRLDRLVARLLSVGKPADPAQVPTNLPQLLDGRLQPWRARAASLGAELELIQGPSLSAAVLIDRDRTGQIIDNLVVNALEAIPSEGGRITIRVAQPEPTGITITVADNGPGIPQETIPHLFEPFFTTKPHGTGLGLFLSAEMARACGGALRYCESPSGAQFEVRLPC